MSDDDTKVIHIQDAPKGWREDSSYVYIGRPSKWGNPFPLEEDSPQARKECIRQYKDWFRDQVFLFKAIAQGELDGKKLVCFCKPKTCHGDVLADIANQTRKLK